MSIPRNVSESLGFLLLLFVMGSIAGLAATSVVASIISFVSILALGYLGLEGQLHKDVHAATRPRQRGLIIGLGSFGMLAGLVIGIQARTGEWLGPSIENRVARWTDARYDVTTARALVAMELTGFDGRSSVGPPPTPHIRPVLFAGGSGDRLHPTKFKENAEAYMARINEAGGTLADCVKEATKDVPKNHRFWVMAACWRTLKKVESIMQARSDR